MIDPKFIEEMEKCFEIGSETHGKGDPKDRDINIETEWSHAKGHAATALYTYIFVPDQKSGLSHWVHAACRLYNAWLAEQRLKEEK